MVHSLVVCLTTGPKTLPKRALHIVRSRASSFKSEYPLLSLRSSNSFLRLLPCLPVTSIPPCIFPSVTRCRRQFRRKMWPIQFAFRLRISCRIFLCLLIYLKVKLLHEIGLIDIKKATVTKSSVLLWYYYYYYYYYYYHHYPRYLLYAGYLHLYSWDKPFPWGTLYCNYSDVTIHGAYIASSCVNSIVSLR